MQRRRLLASTGAMMTAAVAGCLSSSGDDANDEPSEPDTDASPEDLLPESPSGWELDDDGEPAVGMVGADAGWWGEFVDTDGNEYRVEVKRWASEDDARENAYETDELGWTHWVVRGECSWATRLADDPETDESPALLGMVEYRSPGSGGGESPDWVMGV